MFDDLKLTSLENLLSASVLSSQKTILGPLEEVMLDVESGCIAYIVCTLREKTEGEPMQFAIPWKALEYEQESGNLIVKANKQRGNPTIQNKQDKGGNPSFFAYSS